MDRSVGVVVPAYRPDVERLAAYVRALDERLDPASIRIELDAPEPGVADRLRTLPATVAAVPRRRGKGAAVTAGFEALETDVLAFADADGSTPAASIADVLAPVVDGGADLAVGSRRHPDATVAAHQTVARRHMGDAFAFVARRALGVDLHDFQCGAKATTRETWDDVREHIYEGGFAWDLELIAVAAARDRRIAEVPVVWEDHPGSTVAPVRTSLRLVRSLVAVRRRARKLRGRDAGLSAAVGGSDGVGDLRPLIERLAAGEE